MMRFAFYISETKDPDLVGLLNEIGVNAFRSLAKLCLRGLFDKQAADEAILYAKGKPKGKKKDPEYENGYIKIRIWLNGDADLEAESVLSSVKTNMRSMFLKTVIRQILGPQVLLKYFLDDNAESFFAEAVYVPIRTIKVSSAVPVQELSTCVTDSPTKSVKSGKTVKTVKEKLTNVDDALASDSGSIQNSIPIVQNTDESLSPIPLPTSQMEPEGVSDSSSDDSDFDVLSMLEAML